MRVECDDPRREKEVCMTNPQASMQANGPAQVLASGGTGRWFVLSAVVILLDQLSKLWIVQNFDYGESVELLPVLNITLRYNTGAAFSFLADASGWQRW